MLNSSLRFKELATFVPEIAKEHQSSVAMIWPGLRVTYADLDIWTSKVSSALQLAETTRGLPIGVFMTNSPEMVYIWLGILRAGHVFVPFNSALKGDLLEYQINDSRIKTLFVNTGLLDKVSMNIRNRVRVVTVGETADGSEDFEQFCDEGSENQVPHEVSSDSSAAILYTSGTTGHPRGVIIPHFSFVNRVSEISHIVNLRESDVFYNTLPFFHTSGQVMTTLPALLNGLTVVQDTWFHTSTFWRFASENRATVGFLLMRMVNSLLQSDTFVQNSFRAFMSGGVRRETLQTFEKRFGIQLIEGFGMTETCGISIFNTIEERKTGSIGKPLPSVEVKIVDEEGIELPQNQAGEICLRPTIPDTFLSEYLNLPEINRKLWNNGWFATGDLGFKDADGYFYYVERKKDLIRVREENVSPSQIEAAIEAHPSVVESAAVGVKTELGDEEILLALKVRNKPLPKEMLEFLDARLPFYMVPRYLLFLEELPKTPNQKIRRQAIREIGLSDAIDSTVIGFRARRPNE